MALAVALGPAVTTRVEIETMPEFQLDAFCWPRNAQMGVADMRITRNGIDTPSACGTHLPLCPAVIRSMMWRTLASVYFSRLQAAV